MGDMDSRMRLGVCNTTTLVVHARVAERYGCRQRCGVARALRATLRSDTICWLTI